MNTTSRTTQTQQMPQTPVSPLNVKIDDRAVKRIAGEAISKVGGVLEVEGSLADMLKPSDDPTKGLGVTMSEDGKKVQITIKLITEYGKNIPSIVDEVEKSVRSTLLEMAGLTVESIAVEIADVMTRDEYETRTGKNRSAIA